jgi:TolB-like protein/Flp pilus assembly protein TadD
MQEERAMTTPTAGPAFAERYHLEEEIGRGGAAVVYAAADLRHGRRVAVKVMHREPAAAEARERFLSEIRIAAGLNHPHILPLHDSGVADGSLYYVMPLVDGGSLRERLLRERQLPLADAVRITCDVADALDCAHRHGVVHRDVKPENILFVEGHAAVADFGIARALQSAPDAARTDPGLVIGTPEYICPEAYDGVELDGRADQYALACVLYEMLAGQPPFTAATPQAVALRHMADAVPPLTTVRPDVPAAVARAVEQAMAKSPAARFPSTLAFADVLRETLAGTDVTAMRSVAVLPFANLGGLPEDDPLADGIGDEILQVLTRIEGLHVASRTSARALHGRGLDVRAIAGELRVGAVLEGTVQRAGARLRVTVQLVNARDGYLLWSDRYDRAMADVFAIQDEIARNVTRALQVILRDDRPPARAFTRDVRAYEYYLRGRQYFRQTRRKSLLCAREMFQRAVALDDGFARAWAGVADCCSLLHMYFPESGADLSLADQASGRALALAPDDGAAHAARGFTLWRLQHVPEAEAEFTEAVRLDPSCFEALYFHARLAFSAGRTEQAAALFEAAARVQEDYQARFFAAQSLEALGRHEEARTAYRRALQSAEQHMELNPDDPRAATMCAVSLCRLGRRDEGLAWAERARAIDPDDPGVMYNVACLYALEGQADLAIDCLEQALRAGFGGGDWIAHDPDLDSLRDLPRFQRLAWK